MAALPAGGSVQLLVKVQAPSGATSGEVDALTITATDPVGTCGTTAPIADTTTVLAGQIRLDKFQALSTWNGTSCDTAGAYSKLAMTQKPGDCVWYRVIATNEGDANVTNVVINDATPFFTTFAGGGACTNSVGVTGTATISGAGSTVGNTGAVKCATWTTVPPSATTQLEFAVRIDP